jgi:hypothetical protein
MEIKKLQTSPIQQRDSIETSEASANRILQTGVGRIKNGFDEPEIFSDGLKLFSDDEISSAQDSGDIFQVIDQPATEELGEQNSIKKKALNRYKKF